jgi:hypothetical protein
MPKKRCVIALFFLLLTCSPIAALAEGYKEATEQAYCAGARLADIAYTKRTFGDDTDTHDFELKGFRAITYAKGAIRQRIIDLDAATKMMQAGYADQLLCNQGTWRCLSEAAERAKKVSVGRSQQQSDTCMLLVTAICERAAMNCE